MSSAKLGGHAAPCSSHRLTREPANAGRYSRRAASASIRPRTGLRKVEKLGDSQKASTARASKRKATTPPVLHTTLVLPAQPAAQLHHVPQASDDSAANISSFRTSTAAHCGDVDNMFGEDHFARLCRPLIPIASDPRQRLVILKSNILLLHSQKTCLLYTSPSPRDRG